MPDREKIICMTRLSILEKEYGKEIMEAGSSFGYDWVVSRVLGAALRATVIFVCVLVIWAVCSADLIFSVAAGPGASDLLVCVLAIYIVFLVLVMFFAAAAAVISLRKAREVLLERDRLLAILDDDLTDDRSME